MVFVNFVFLWNFIHFTFSLTEHVAVVASSGAGRMNSSALDPSSALLYRTLYPLVGNKNHDWNRKIVLSSLPHIWRS